MAYVIMKYEGEIGKYTIFIDTWSSTCGNCGLGADPEEKKHKTELGYGANGAPGCGIKWKYVSSNYAGNKPERWCKQMRPDLKYLNLFDVLKEEPKVKEELAA
jgi:hypothetical protein